MPQIYLKLRNNISLESDLQLAEREISKLFKSVVPISLQDISSVSFLPHSLILSNTKPSGIIGYLVSENNIPLFRILQLLSFVQEVWSNGDSELEQCDFSIKVGDCVCSVPLMAMSEFVFFTKKPTTQAPRAILEALSLLNTSNKDVNQSIGRKNTSAPHVHSFHTYKAKFFPRFVHSLIVSNINPSRNDIDVCDCFVGSGTTLIESALMGFNSVGIDIDKLSCFISDVKSQALNFDNKQPLLTPIDSPESAVQKYEFPSAIVKKFERWESLDEMEAYQNEITDILKQISAEPSPYDELHRIALSDALTRKFNVRMMGTGSGRFALEIGARSLPSLISSDLENEKKAIFVINLIKQLYKVNTPQPKVIHGSATNRPLQDKSFDVIITSPPYIPASSGREDYLVGKLISLKALGFYDEESVKYCSENSVGSMADKSEDLKGMPKDVVRLYDWLINDELRCVKARPIIAYYKALIAALQEDFRTIKDDGKVIYIIGKETIFYSSSTKEILYQVECDKIFAEIASQVGFKVDEMINIELDKKDNIARPRGSDKYYECAVILSKA